MKSGSEKSNIYDFGDDTILSDCDSTVVTEPFEVLPISSRASCASAAAWPLWNTNTLLFKERIKRRRIYYLS